MSSSQNSAALGRARSLRKPTTRSDTAATDQNNGSSQQRSTSPSRLPVQPSATGMGTGTLRRARGEVRGSRPLSGVFGRGTAGSTSSATTGAAGRQVSTSTNSEPSTRLARAPSIRQVSTASTNTEASGTSGTSRLTRAASIRQLSTSSAKSGVSATSEGSSIAPPRRTTTTAEQLTPLSRRPTVTESTSTSSRRPTTSSGVPPRRLPSAATPSSHSRAKSSVTALSSTAILRPPSSTSQASTATSTSTERNDRSKPPITRAPVTTAAHKRAPSHPTTTNPSTPGIGRTRSLKLEGPAGIVKPTKPEFNTHQQHFSPLKNPHLSKPLTSAILAPPSPSKLPANVAISAETTRLQTELLQLSLLHSSAGSVKAEWEASAYNKLQARFHDVAEQEKEVLKLENRSVESNAVKELLGWGKGRGGLEEKVRVLDEVLSTIWALTEPYSHNHKGGRYIRVVRQFEKWLGKAEEVMAGREQHDGELVEAIGGDWKEELGGLSRKVHAIRQDLYGIVEGVVGAEGNLGRVLGGVRELVEGMVEEIEIMEVVEREVGEREMEWVRGVNREGEEGEGKRRAGAVWRAF